MFNNARTNTVRIIAIILLLLTGLNAVVAGALFMADPSGGKMGMSVSYLQHSPFQSFLVPGIVLFIVNGLFNIIAARLAIKKQGNFPVLIAVQGVLLSGWILVQVIFVRDFNLLHAIMLCIGAMLVTGGLLLKQRLGNDD